MHAVPFLLSNTDKINNDYDQVVVNTPLVYTDSTFRGVLTYCLHTLLLQ